MKFDGAREWVNGLHAEFVERDTRQARIDRRLSMIAGSLLVALAIGWTWVAVSARDGSSPAAALAASITQRRVPMIAYMTDALVAGIARSTVESESGGTTSDSLPPNRRADSTVGGRLGIGEGSSTASTVARVAGAISGTLRGLVSFEGMRFVPLSERNNGRIGTYRVGRWPTEGRRAVKANYEPPPGFIEVTQQNADTYVSEHFRLRDFLTHDQQGVWPKYLVLQRRLIDKLEYTVEELERAGHPVTHITVMSGFRTPQYNSGGGNTAGRADLSRHMYGDASDVFVDNDRNGTMDDLNHDGRVDVRDACVIQDAVDRVERAHPELVGGVGVYVASSGHGPFTHIDARGYRARWVGSGGG